MNAIEAYQLLYKTREIPYCSHMKHPHVIEKMEEINECIRKNCFYLQFYYPEEIEVLLKNRR